MATKVSPATGQADYPGDGWTVVNGYATDAYFQQFGDWHTGNDLTTANAEGKPVYAALDGVIKWAEFAGDNGFGNLVYIQHTSTLYTRYGHLASISVQNGQTVTAGTILGTVGHTGRSTASNLHFDISRTNNALDWPGTDKARVLQNYIDPAAWYAQATVASVDPVATQWLYVNAPAGLNVRANPGLAGGKPSVKLPNGSAVQVTAVRIDKDGFTWRQLISGGWIAEAYTLTTPPDMIVSPVGVRTPVVTTPIPAPAPPAPLVTPPTPAPAPAAPIVHPTVSVALRGVHASAGGWSPDDGEIALVRHNGVQSVLIASYQPHQAQLAIPRFKGAGVTNFIIRAVSNAPITSNPTDYVNDSLPRLKEYYDALGGQMILAVHNEPNVINEGWSKAWQNGTEFAQWFLKAAAAYRTALLGVRIGFPALSPGGDASGVREDEWRFAGECAQAIAASDWVGVHAYFTNDGSDLDVKPQQWQQMAQGRSVIITEGGPADHVQNTGAKLHNVYMKCAGLGLPVMAWLLSGAGAWQSAGWKEQNVAI